MKKIKTKYLITITSDVHGTFSIKRAIKKSDKSIKRIKHKSTQKTTHHGLNDYVDYKFLHHFIITTKPTAEFKSIYANIFANKHILDISIKLI